jgi:hypothetical protein
LNRALVDGDIDLDATDTDVVLPPTVPSRPPPRSSS